MAQNHHQELLGVARAQLIGGMLDQSVLRNLIQLLNDVGSSQRDRLQAAMLLSRIPCLQE